MATKSRKSRFNIGFKILAWALCVASACGIIFAARTMGLTGVDNAVPNYADSYDNISNLQTYTNYLKLHYFEPTDYSIRLETEERTGILKNERNQEIASALEWGYYELLDSGTGMYNYDTEQVVYFDDFLEPVRQETSTSSEEAAAVNVDEETTASSTDAAEAEGDVTSFSMEEAEDVAAEHAETAPIFREISETGSGYYPPLTERQIERVTQIVQDYEELIGNAKQFVINERQAEREEASEYIARRTDMQYAIVDGGELVESNADGDAVGGIQAIDAKMISTFTKEGDAEYVYTGNGTVEVEESYFGQPIFYVAPTAEAYARHVAAYNEQYDAFKVFFVWLIVCIIAFIMGFVWLMYTAGRRPDSDEVRLLPIDKIVYLDIGFIIMLVCVGLLLLGAYLSSGSIFQFFGSASIDAIGVFGMCVCLGGAVSVVLLWCTCLQRRVRHGGAGEFTLAYLLFGSVKKLYDESGLKSKAVAAFVWYAIAGIVIAGILCVGVAFRDIIFLPIGIILIIIYIMLSLRFTLKKAAGVAEIARGVKEIKDGDLEYTIPARGNYDLDKISADINNIAEGLSNAVHREVKSERMKTELITNISHDLRTPLTSILTYIDLLKKEEGLSQSAKGYLDVLDMKSYRLKALTDDLFEAAKASSGDVTVDLSRIELVQFMEQALGEISDRMESSGLVFINTIPQEELYVHADGKLLFRVINNVMDNVMKYSLPDSRVYLDIRRDGEGHIDVVVKNISKEELNITEDELMERFVRGDSSRNTEGSGLGLAIARNFMQLMGGRFLIEIDGDLFKVKIELPEVEPQEKDEAGENEEPFCEE
ncbi:HAMP domain-containing histidine kinase [Christensenellaceae bacterium OttesenSCG-928-K19]|nr:HAMP domain-containing histidine kinase [Christensenellaceae bacterium OttesenSCG-928-K19]